jgi:acetyl-CoA carboxylase biotin carboxyl carrier protein
MDLTNEDVADVLALLDSLPYDELDLQTTRFRLILRRTPDGWTQSAESLSAPDMLDPAPPDGPATAPGPPAAAPSPPAAAPSPPAAAPMEHRCRHSSINVPSVSRGEGTDLADGEADGASGESGESGELGDGRRVGSDGGPGLVAVRAPLPGTFYRAPRPGAAPFVEVGSRVDRDTVVGIVETMKLMNSVSAGVDGTVAEICLGNAEFAANGTTLLRIRVD